MKRNNTFVFNLAWYDVLSEYTPEVRLEVYEAIMQYASTGTTGELGPLSKMAFMFIKREVDYNRERYEEVSEKRRDAGRKRQEAARADKIKQTPASESNGQQSSANGSKHQQTLADSNKTQQTVANSSKHQQTPTSESNGQQSSANGSYNDIDNDNVDDNDIDIKETDKEKSVSPDRETCRAKSPDATVPFSGIMDFWNKAMEGKAISSVSSVTPTSQRGVSVKARFKEYGIERIYQAILNVANSDFLNGRNSRGFIATFDWVFKPSNFIKVLDGNYKNNETDKQDRFSERRGTEPGDTDRKGFKGTL